MNAACQCGWLRPLIMLVTIDGSEPSRNLIPAYACPACGVPYISVPVPVALQERIERALFRAEHEVKN